MAQLAVDLAKLIGTHVTGDIGLTNANATILQCIKLPVLKRNRKKRGLVQRFCGRHLYDIRVKCSWKILLRDTPVRHA